VQIAKTLSAYIARQFFAWFCGVIAAMLVISFLLDYIELIRRGGTRIQATLWILLEMAALKLPHTAQEVMPFAIMFGTMLAFWRLTRSNELVIARASGISVWQFMTPPVLVALLVGIVAVTVFNPIGSAMEASYEKLESRILRQGSDELSLSDAGLWLRQADDGGGQIVIHARTPPSPDQALDTVTLFLFDSRGRFTGRVEAQRARLQDGYWVIEDGRRWATTDAPPTPFAQLRVATKLTPRNIEESFASPDTMSFWDLPGFIDLLEQSGFSAQRHRLHFNVLLARPFLFCAMVLVAATFSLRLQRRGGATMMIVGGVGSGFVLFFVSNIVVALGLSGKLPVLLAAWTPIGISTIFGLSMLLHMEDG
jgi:lipopolysaccharide export system permease protein